MNHNVMELDTVEFFTDDASRNEPIVGMRINALSGESITVPMNGDTAEQVGELLIAHARMFRDIQSRAVTPAKRHAQMQRHTAGVK